MRFFVKTKVVWYRRGLEGFPLAGLLAVADSKVRMESLAGAIDDRTGRVSCKTIESIRGDGMPALPVDSRQDGVASKAR